MTDKKTESLKLALEALEECRRDPRLKYEHPYYDKTITAIREALAEQPAQVDPCPGCLKGRVCRTPKCGRLKLPADHPLRSEQPAQQQEPVVWMYVNKSTHETKFQKHMSDFVDHSLWSEAPLYGEPLANHELQCVCGAVWLGEEMVHLPDKRPPASKPWVGLTSEDKVEILRANGEAAVLILTEAKLREKNA